MEGVFGNLGLHYWRLGVMMGIVKDGQRAWKARLVCLPGIGPGGVQVNPAMRGRTYCKEDL